MKINDIRMYACTRSMADENDDALRFFTQCVTVTGVCGSCEAWIKEKCVPTYLCGKVYVCCASMYCIRGKWHSNLLFNTRWKLSRAYSIVPSYLGRWYGRMLNCKKFGQYTTPQVMIWHLEQYQRQATSISAYVLWFAQSHRSIAIDHTSISPVYLRILFIFQ